MIKNKTLLSILLLYTTINTAAATAIIIINIIIITTTTTTTTVCFCLITFLFLTEKTHETLALWCSSLGFLRGTLWFRQRFLFLCSCVRVSRGSRGVP